MSSTTMRYANNAASNDHTPAVLSLGQVWVENMMDVPDIPRPGDFVVTQKTTAIIGGSYRVLLAAKRSGSPAKHAGIVGSGVYGAEVRKAFELNGIEHVGQDRLDADTGFRLVLNDGERKTFITSHGVETQGDETTFSSIVPDPGDIVHLSGDTLMDHTASGIEEFLSRAGTDPRERPYTMLLNPTNAMQVVSDHLLENMVLAHPIWSCNRQEAQTLSERLGLPKRDITITVGGGFDDSMTRLCETLGGALGAPLIVRAGSRGAWVRDRGKMSVNVPGFPTKPIHTRSAGTCHTGVLAAMLAQGHSLFDATHIANAAASIAIDRSVSGLPNCPNIEATMALLENQDSSEQGD